MSLEAHLVFQGSSINFHFGYNMSLETHLVLPFKSIQQILCFLYMSLKTYLSWLRFHFDKIPSFSAMSLKAHLTSAVHQQHSRLVSYES